MAARLTKPNRTARNAPSAHPAARDEWQARLWRTVGLAIGKWLEERGRLDQPIRALQLRELQGIGWAGISAWLEVREARRIELNMPPVHGDPRQADPMDELM